MRHRELALALGAVEQLDVAGRIVPAQDAAPKQPASVLHGGEPLAVEQGERLQHQRVTRLALRLRDHVVEQRVRRFLERTRGLAGLRVADDDAVLGILRVFRDPRQGQRLRVGPAGVAVVARHVGGPVADDRIELLPGRQAAGERAVQPASAQHPRALGVLRGKGLDLRLHSREVLLFDQVHLLERERAAADVDVRVVEARRHQPARELDDLGLRPAQRFGSRGIAHVDDAVAADRHRLGPGPGVIGRPDPPARQDPVRRRVGRRRDADAEKPHERRRHPPHEEPPGPRIDGHSIRSDRS